MKEPLYPVVRARWRGALLRSRRYQRAKARDKSSEIFFSGLVRVCVCVCVCRVRDFPVEFEERGRKDERLLAANERATCLRKWNSFECIYIVHRRSTLAENETKCIVVSVLQRMITGGS